MHRALEYNALDTAPLSGRREIKRRKRRKKKPEGLPWIDSFFCRVRGFFFCFFSFLTAGLDGCLSKHLLAALHPADRVTKIDCSLASHPHAVPLAKKSNGNLESGGGGGLVEREKERGDVGGLLMRKKKSD